MTAGEPMNHYYEIYRDHGRRVWGGFAESPAHALYAMFDEHLYYPSNLYPGGAAAHAWVADGDVQFKYSVDRECLGGVDAWDIRKVQP